MTGNENTTKFLARMPPQMHAAIKQLANTNRRSMNSELLVLLETGLDHAALPPARAVNPEAGKS